MGDDEWTVVEGPSLKAQSTSASEEELAAMSKAQVKNLKRAQRRKEQRSASLTEEEMLADYVPSMEVEVKSGRVAAPPVVVGTRRDRRRTMSVEDSDVEEEPTNEEEVDLELAVALQKRVRKAEKVLRGMKANAEERRPAAVLELAETKQLLEECLARCAGRAASKSALREARLRQRHSEGSLMLQVEFESEYACPICTEVLEAAVSVPCRHVFCRGCLEDHVGAATKPADCACPMCRAPLCDANQGHRVDARPKTALRSRLKTRRATCHCGAEMPLSTLRDHLRGCGPNAHTYPARRKFGHEFKQPSFVGGGKEKTPAQRTAAQNLADEEEERIQLQAAILASMTVR